MATYIDTKIDLILNHLTRERYEDLLSSDKLSANELYLVDEEYLDAMGARVENVADPILSSDAANKHYVDSVSESISVSLLSDISSIQESLSIFLSVLMVETTWSELTAMRSNSKLIPGMSYRMTDYETTVDVAETELEDLAQSTGNQFDLIVVADSVSSLNEVAHAIRHEGDSYFPESTKFEVWKVWYCLDNDRTRFIWADTENGKGVIYRLIDEFNNDVPYDFKNVQFIPYTPEEDWSDGMRYTFDDGEGNDASLLTDSNVKNNGIRPYIGYYYDKSTGAEYYSFALNRIVFLGNGCYNNSLGNDCFKNSFGNECRDNSFGNGCSGNFFGNRYSGNSFGNGCSENSFGNDFYYNSLGNGCSGNSFGDNCYDNSFGKECFGNSFRNDCYYNSLENGCSGNSFGDNCYDNSFGNECFGNSFGDNCYNNSFRDNCHDNSFGNECFGNSFGNECFYNSFGNSSELKDYYRYITIESGNRYIYLDCTNHLLGTEDESGNIICYQNVSIRSGTNNKEDDGEHDPYKTISDSNVGQTFHTTYQPANSIVVSV